MEERTFTIGRERSCDVVLADDSISRKHAQLTFLNDGKLFLTDCHSTHGTFLKTAGSQKTISQGFVAPTDTIIFGKVEVPIMTILNSIQARFPQLGHRSFTGPAQQKKTPGKPWVQGSRLTRCKCGAVRSENYHCPECGL